VSLKLKICLQYFVLVYFQAVFLFQNKRTSVITIRKKRQHTYTYIAFCILNNFYVLESGSDDTLQVCEKPYVSRVRHHSQYCNIRKKEGVRRGWYQNVILLCHDDTTGGSCKRNHFSSHGLRTHPARVKKSWRVEWRCCRQSPAPVTAVTPVTPCRLPSTTPCTETQRWGGPVPSVAPWRKHSFLGLSAYTQEDV
jgi:hypothetical protein